MYYTNTCYYNSYIMLTRGSRSASISFVPQRYKFVIFQAVDFMIVKATKILQMLQLLEIFCIRR